MLGAGPEIFSINPDEAPAGAPILIRGRHLKDTKRVVFAAGPIVKPAQFKALSDRELEVIAPEFLRWNRGHRGSPHHRGGDGRDAPERGDGGRVVHVEVAVGPSRSSRTAACSGPRRASP